MKKLIITLIAIAGAISVANAQVDVKAIGLRLGWDAEVSYQHPFGNSNRLEIDLGFGLQSNYIHANGVYQWVWDLSALAPGFNWYAGVGAGVGFASKVFQVGVVGDIGIEYNFNIPLQLALDWRPGLDYTSVSSNGSFGFGWEGFALGIRFKF